MPFKEGVVDGNARVEKLFIVGLVLLFGGFGMAQAASGGKVIGPSNLTGGPDTFGYRFIDQLEPQLTFNFYDISSTGALVVSASNGEGVERILDRVGEMLESDIVEKDIRLMSSDKEGISRVYALAEVVRALYHDGYVDIRFRTSRARARALNGSAECRDAG